MTTQKKYITSLLSVFSTFLESHHVSRDLALLTTEKFVVFINMRKNSDKNWVENWSTQSLENFLSAQNVPHKSAVLMKKFVENYTPLEVDVFLHQFLASLKANKRANSTIKNYRSDIQQFSNLINCKKISQLFEPDNLRSFVHKQIDSGLKISTVKRKLSSISQFALWAENEKIVKDASFWISDIESLVTGNNSIKYKQPLAHNASDTAKSPSKELEDFLLSLEIDKHSAATVKNYKSDIKQFLNHSTKSKLDKIITQEEVTKFVVDQRKLGLKASSIKRKLSSISKFALWAESRNSLPGVSYWIHQLPAKLFEVSKPETPVVKSSNIGPAKQVTPELKIKTNELVHAHQKHTKTPKVAWSLPVPDFATDTSVKKHQEHVNLKKENIKEDKKAYSGIRSSLNDFANQINTKRNKKFLPYLNLVMMVIFVIGLGFLGYQQFITQAPTPFAYPTSPTRPNRELSFQGRLTDTAQNPIITSTNMAFRLYDDVSAGTQLWSSGTCSVTPDQDGIFNVGLGDDCGSEITEDVFTENSNVWLEVEIASETLTPRQSIKTVAYALNSETVQGYPVSATGAATTNTILVMDSAGQVLLGEVSPILKSTTGTFSIEAQALTLQTSSGSDGDIILDPDGLGEVLSTGYFSAPGATFSATYAGGTSLVLKGGPSGTANIQEWQQSDGTVLSVVDENGNLGIGTSAPVAQLELVTGSNWTKYNTANIESGWSTQTRFQLVQNHGSQFGLPTGDSGALMLATGSVDTGKSYITGGGGGTAALHFYVGDATAPKVSITRTNGNVGIGSLTPGYKLDLVGEFNLTDAIRLNTDAGTNGYLLTSSAGGLNTWTDPDTIGGIWTNTDNVYHPTNSFADVADLVLGGTSTASADIHFLSDGSAVFNQQGNDADFRVEGSGAANALFVQGSDGNVGIGTTAPLALLDVSSLNSEAKLRLTRDDGAIADTDVIGTIDFAGNDVQVDIADRIGASIHAISEGIWGSGSEARAALTFNTRKMEASSPIERMRIDSDGNIGIGTTSPLFLLDVAGTASLNSLNINDAYTFPTIDGTNGYVLQTDGGGTVSWASVLTDSPNVGAWSHGDHFLYPDEYWVDDLIIGGNSTASATFQVKADGSGYFAGNVGIGTSNPTALLDIDGTGLTSTNLFTLTDDTGTDLTFNTSPGDSRMTINYGGSKRMMLGSSGMGIGPGSQVTAFGITGSIGFRGNNPVLGGAIFGVDGFQGGTHASLAIGTEDYQPSTGYGAAGIVDIATFRDVGNTWSGIRPTIRYTAEAHQFRVNSGSGSGNPGTDALYIAADANIGIGTTSPIGLLNVEGSATGKALTILNETGDQNVFEASVSGTSVFTIANDGNIGIGTSDPSAALEITGESGGTVRLFKDNTNGRLINITRTATDSTFFAQRTNIVLDAWQNSGDRYVRVQNSGGYLAHFTTTGNIGIGSLTPGYELDLVGEFNLTDAIRLNTDAGTNGYLLTSSAGGLNTWTDPDTIGGIWTNTLNVYHPTNSFADVADLVLGGTSTASANIHLQSSGDAYFAGNIGIGSSSPQFDLDNGQIGINNNSFEVPDGVVFSNYANGAFATIRTAGIDLGLSSSTGTVTYGDIDSGATYGIDLQIDGSTKLTVEGSSGNIGIGTTAPNGLLEVANYSAGVTRGDFIVDSANKTTYVGRLSSTTSDHTKFVVRDRLGTEYFVSDPASVKLYMKPGSTVPIGMGTNSAIAGSKLHVLLTGGKTTTAYGAYIQNTSSSSTASINKYGTYITSTGTWNGASANNIGLYVGSVTGGTNNYDAIFNGGGNVGIGTTAPGAKLHLQGATTDIDSVTASGSNLTTDWNNDALFKIDQASSGGNAMAFSVSGTGNERKGYIQIGHTDGDYSNALGDLSLNPFGGNIGIGTTNPLFLLDVAGTASLNSLNINDAYTFPTSDGSVDYILQTDGAGSVTWEDPSNITGAGLWANTLNVFHAKNELASVIDLVLGGTSTASANIHLQSDGQAYFAGNVGIGTTAPSSALDVIGIVEVADGSEAAPSYTFGDQTGTGFYRSGTSSVSLSLGGTDHFKVNSVLTVQVSDQYLGWVNGSLLSGTSSQGWYQDGTGIIMQRSFNSPSTTEQEYRISNTWTDASNNEFASLGFINNANTFTIQTEANGTGTLRDIALMGGNVGIGTTAPEEKLDIAGGSILLDNAQWIKAENSGGGNIRIAGIDGSNNVVIGDIDGAGGYLGFDTAGNRRMVILANGNVGIGTTGPDNTLEVMAPIGDGFKVSTSDPSNTGSIKFRDQGGISGRYYPTTEMWTYGSQYAYASTMIRIPTATDTGTTPAYVFDARQTAASITTRPLFDWRNYGSSVFMILADGNIGIGTTSPQSTLNISSGVGSLATGLSFGDGDTGIYEVVDDQLRFTSGNGASYYTLSGGTFSGSATGGASLFYDNNASALAYHFNSDTDTGINWISANKFGLYTGGNNVLVADASGNVGIGSTSPANKLDILGNARAINLISASGGIGSYQNLLTWSEDFSNANWSAYISKPGVTTSIDDPFGGTNATRFASAGSNYSGVFQSGTLTSGNTYTASVWLRAVSGTLNVTYGLSDSYQTTSTIDTTWRKYTYTATPSSNQARKFQVLENTASNTAWEIAFPQTEESSSPKTYAKTEGTAITTRIAGLTTGELYVDNFSGNVGIGSTAPSQKLDISGSIRLGTAGAGNVLGTSATTAPTGDLYWGNRVVCDDSGNCGTAGMPSGTSGQTIRHNGSDWIATNLLYNNGVNVGIGTTNPLFKLAVDGDIAALNGSNIWLKGGGSLGLENSSGNNAAYISNYGATGVSALNIADSLYVEEAGNIGVGTTAPVSQLSIESTSPVLTLGNTTVNQTLGGTIDLLEDAAGVYGTNGYGFRMTVDGTTNDLYFRSVNGVTLTDRMIIDRDTGNVGIGTITPQSKFAVAGDNATTNFSVQNTSGTISVLDTTTPSAVGTGGTIVFGSTYYTAGNTMATATIGSYKEYAPSNGVNEYNHALVFKTGRQSEGVLEKMRIDSVGNVGIGTTAPGAQLDINSSSTSLGNHALRISGNATYTYGRLGFYPNSGSVAGVIEKGSTASLYFGETADTGGYVFRGSGDTTIEGNVGIGSATPAYKLDVVGDIKIENGSDLYTYSGASYSQTLGSRSYTEDNYVTDAQTLTASVDALDQAVYDISTGAGGLWTDGGTTTYLTSLTDDFAVGGTGLASPFSVDESTNTVRIGEGSGSNAQLNMFASDTDTGNITYNTSDQWVFSGGDVKLNEHLTVGSGGTINANYTATIYENYASLGSGTSISLNLSQTRTESSAITASTTAYGINNILGYNMTEDLVTPYHGYGYASNNTVYATGTSTFGWLRGSSNTAYTNSTSATNQDSIAGTSNSAFVNSSGTLSNAFGTYNQAYAASTGTVISAYGSSNNVFSNAAGATINTAKGVYARIYEGAGTVTTGIAGDFVCDDATTCYGLNVSVDDVQPTTNYGIVIDAANATTNNYGIYGVRGDWILEEDGSGVAGGTGAGGDLILGAGRDLELYHDGTNSYINNNTGEFFIRNSSSSNLTLDTTGGYIDLRSDSSTYGVIIRQNGDTSDWGNIEVGETYLGLSKNSSDPQMVIDDDGNVGIGSITPASKLDVSGRISQTGNASTVTGYLQTNSGALASTTNLNPGLLVYGGNGTNSNYGMDLGYDSTWRTRLFSSGAATDIAFGHMEGKANPTVQSDFTELMTIKGGGNVGIGTTSPSIKLEVAGGVFANSENTISFASGANGNAQLAVIKKGGENAILAAANNEPLRFGKSSANAASLIGTAVTSQTITEFARFDSNGNYGIGTTSPLFLLDVAGTASLNSLNINDEYTFPTIDGTNGYVLQTDGGGTVSWASVLTDSPNVGAWSHGDHFLYPDEYWADDLIIGGNSTASATFQVKADGSGYFAGNVGVGTTSVAGGVKLEIRGGNIRIPTSNYYELGNSLVSLQRVGSTMNLNAYSGWKFYDTQNSVNRVTINSDGNVGIGTTVPTGLLNVEGAATGKALTILNETGDQSIFEASVSGSSVFTIANAGNVGIGTTAPAQKLEIKGSAYGDAILRLDNSVHTWDIEAGQTGYSSQALSFYHDGNQQLRIMPDGSNGIVLNSTKFRFANGNVGVGVDPSYKLDVSGEANFTDAIRVAGNAGTSGYFLTSSAGGANTWTDPDTITGAGLWDNTLNVFHPKDELAGVVDLTLGGDSTASANIHLQSNGQAYFGGNVGVGTSSPNNRFEVATTFAGSIRQDAVISNLGTTNGTGQKLGFRMRNSTDSTDIMAYIGGITIDSINRDSALVFQTMDNGGTSEAMRIDQVGNVGIGTTTPEGSLHVSNGNIIAPNTGADDLIIEKTAGNAGLSILTDATSTGQIFFGDTGGATPGRIRYDHNANDLSLWTADTERLTILSNGNVGIGTTTPNETLDVTGTGRFSSTLTLDGVAASTDNTVLVLNASNQVVQDEIDSRVWGTSLIDGSGTANYVARFSDADTLTTGVLYDNGTNVGIGTTAPTQKLEIVGNSTDYIATLRSSDAGGEFLKMVSETGDNVFEFQSRGAGGEGDLKIYSDGIEKIDLRADGDVWFDNDGNVGIGTTVPNGLLEVANYSAGVTRGDFIVDSANKTTYVGRLSSTGSDHTKFVVRDRLGTEYFVSDPTSAELYMNPGSTVSIGLGTNSAQSGSRVDIRQLGAKTATSYGSYTQNISTSSTASINKYGAYITSTGTWNGASANNIGLYIGSVTGGTNNYDAIFNGGGNVGVGTTAPSYKLDIASGTNDGISLGSSTRRKTLTWDASVSPWDVLNITSNGSSSGWRGAIDLEVSYNGGSAFPGLTVKANTDGTTANVGIGVTAPAYALDLVGEFNLTDAIRVAGDAGTSGYFLTSSAGGANTWTDPDSITGAGLWANTLNVFHPKDELAGVVDLVLGGDSTASANIHLQSNGQAYFGGNVGIGTISPSQKLDVDGNVQVTNGWLKSTNTIPHLYLNDNTTQWDISVESSNLYFNDGVGNDIVVLEKTSGNVGIGTTTPEARLDVSGGDIILDNNEYISFRNTSGTKRDVLTLNSSNKVYIDNPTGGHINLNGSMYVERSNGNIGIGTSSPGSLLDVKGSVEFNRTGTATVGDFSVSGSNNPTMYFGRLSPTTSDSTDFTFRSRLNQNKLTIDTAGGGDITSYFESGGGGSFVVKRLGGDNATFLQVNESTGNVGIGSTNPLYKLDVSGSIHTNTSFGRTDSGLVHITSPDGAAANGGNSETGAIEITLPTFYDSDMMRMVVDIYDYSTDESFTVMLGGYSYVGNNNWYNTFAQIIAGKTDRDFNVRFGDDGTNLKIWIGELGSTWSFPNVIIRDFITDGATFEEYDDGWDITFESIAFDTVTDTESNNLVSSFIASGNNLYSINSGNVGIGSTTPNEKLDVTGNIQFSGSLEPAGLPGTTNQILISQGTGVAPIWSDSVPASSLAWDDLTDPDANLSLGMSTYTTDFNWATGTGANDLFSFTTDASANGTGSLINIQTGAGATLDPLRVRVGTTEGLIVDSAGNVGIGIISPSAKLDVVGDSEFNGDITIIEDGTQVIRGWNGTDDPTIDGLLPSTTSGGIIEAPFNAHYLIGLRENDTNDQFSIISGGGNYNTDTTYDTVVFTAKSDGNVGIGSTTPTELLDINTTATGGGARLGYAYVGNWDSTSGYATFAHNNVKTTAGSYSLLANSSGSTFLNAATGQNVNFRINNVEMGQLQSDGDWTFDTDTLFVDASTNSVGIGAQPGSYKLDVQGTTLIESDDNTGALKIARISNADQALFLRGGAGSGEGRVAAQYSLELMSGLSASTTYDLTLSTAAGEALRVDASAGNNIGIGTTSPTSLLHVYNGDIKVDRGSLIATQDAASDKNYSYRSVLQYHVDVDNSDGAMVITVPDVTNSMMNVRISGYNYNGTSGSWEVVIGGYWYTSGDSWINTSVEIKGKAPFDRVRLMSDNTGTTPVIVLGEDTDIDNWDYPQINVDVDIAGYGAQDEYATGWAGAMSTDISALTAEAEPAIAYYWNSSGNLGIGTTNPANFKLQIAGDIGPTADNQYDLGSASLRWDGIYAAGNVIAAGLSDSDLDTKISVEESADEDKIRFDTAGSERMIIDANGLIGIGTTTPIHKFEVNDSVTGKALVLLKELGDQDILTASNSAGVTRFRMANTGYMYAERFVDVSNSAYYVDPAGGTYSGLFASNVGIGDTTPDYALDVADTGQDIIASFTDTTYGIGNITAGTYSAFGETYSNRSTLIGNNVYADTQSAVGDQLKYRNTHGSYGQAAILMSGGDTKFYNETAATTADAVVSKQLAMIIDGDDGNVGIGSTSPSEKLSVNGSGMFGTRNSSEVLLGETTNASGHEGLSLYHSGAEAFIESVDYGVAWHDMTFRASDFEFQAAGGGSNLYIDNGGNVGINDSSPDAKLDVEGTIRLGTGTSGILEFDSNNDSIYYDRSNNQYNFRIGNLTYVNWNSTYFNYGYGGSIFTGYNSGGVVIGNSPSNPGLGNLNVKGEIGINDATASNLLDINTTASSTSGIDFDGSAALTGYVGNWLRLNQDSAFTSGVYTPGDIRLDGDLQVGSGATSFLSLSADGSTTYNQVLRDDGGLNLHVLPWGNASGWTAVTIGGGASANLVVTGHIYAHTTTHIGDVAEFMKTSQLVTAGDIVATKTDGIDEIVKATLDKQQSIVGVISSQPSVFINSPKEGVPVGMTGKVPIKVSTINGDIKAGDPIALSPIPGIGMKATEPGTIVGIASEDFNDNVISTRHIETTLEYTQSRPTPIYAKKFESEELEITERQMIDPTVATSNYFWVDSNGDKVEDPSSYAGTKYKVARINLVIKNSWYDPSIELIDSGLIAINGDSSTGYTVENNGSSITRISAFSKAFIANITAGLINTQDLIVEQTASITNLSVESFTINGQTLAEYITSIVGQSESGSDLISPVGNDTVVNIATQSGQIAFTNSNDETVATINESGDLSLLGDLNTDSITATGSSTLGSLLVTTDATVSGTLDTNTLTAQNSALGSLIANQATISGTLTVAQDATVAGTLVAGQIEAASSRIALLEAGMAELEHVKATTAEIVTATVSGTLYADSIYANSIYDFEETLLTTLQQPSLLDILMGVNESTTSTDAMEDLYNTINKSEYNATSSADLDLSFSEISMTADDVTLTGTALFVEKYFKVNGSGYVSDSLAVGSSLFVGNTMQLADGLINYTTSDPSNQVLEIQPAGQGSIELLAGIVTIDDSGTVTVNGDIDVTGNAKIAGTLLTDQLKPTDFGNPLQVQVAGIDTQTNEVKKSRFEIINEVGTPVATFSAEGNAEFAGKVDIAGGIGLDSQDLGSSDSNELSTNKTSGKATIKSGANEVTIKTSIIADDTLIYVTAVGSTDNQVIYVKGQASEDTNTPEQEGQFVVGFDNNTTSDVSFNWWIVN